MAGHILFLYRKLALRGFYALLALLFFQQVGMAQVSNPDNCTVSPTAATKPISGVITDPSGAVIPSATVEADCGGLRERAESDRNGSYRLKLRPGTYHLIISAPGFAPITQDLTVAPEGEVLALNLTLRVGPAGSTVTVRADTGYVATDSTAATKTNTPILEIPQSISIVTREQMNDQQPQSLNEALRYSPGVVPESEGVASNFWSGSSLILRGFTPQIYLDGLEDDDDGNDLIDSYFYQRVAVLSGPSSVVYGQGSPGGIIDVESKRPMTIPLHEVVFGLGSYDRYEGMFDLGSAIDANDHFLYRLTGVGFTENTQTQFVNEQRMAIAPAFSWRPDAKTDLTLLSNYTWNPEIGQYAYVPAQGSAVPNPNGTIPTSFYVGDPNFNKTGQRSVQAGDQFIHALNSVWSVAEGFRFTTNRNKANMIWPEALEPDEQTLSRYSWIRNANFDSLIVDGRLSGGFRTGPLKQAVLAGYNYEHWYENWLYGANYTIPSINIFHPVYYQTIAAPTAFEGEDFKANQNGLYAQDQISLARWRFLAGVRQDWVNVHVVEGVLNGHVVEDAFTEKLVPSKLTYRAGVNYVFGNGIAPYFSYSTSFQPQGGTTVTGTALPPETGNQYEGGIKYQLPHTNSLFTAAVYDLTQQNVPTTDPANPNFEIAIGEIRSRGVELGDHTSLTHNLDLIASYAYTDSKYARTNDTAIGIDGVTVPIQGNYQDGVPEQAFSLWGNYTLRSGPASGLGFGGGVRYIGYTYGDEANSFKVPAFPMLDGVFHYDFSEGSPILKGLRFQINGNNILDKSYVSSCTSSNECYFGLRRMVYATFSKRW